MSAAAKANPADVHGHFLAAAQEAQGVCLLRRAASLSFGAGLATLETASWPTAKTDGGSTPASPNFSIRRS